MQSVELLNWTLADKVSLDGTASPFKVVAVDLSELQYPGEIT